MCGYVLQLFWFFMIGVWDKKEIHQLMNTDCCIYIYSMKTWVLLGQILTFAILTSQC